MQKILLAVALVTGLVTTIAAQNLRFTPVVKPTQGGSSRVGNYQLDYTIGEPAQKTLRNGNLVFTEGFEQNGNPLKPTAPASQTVCSDTAVTFVFTNRIAGNGADQVEWAYDSTFVYSNYCSTDSVLKIRVQPGQKDTIWLRSRLSGSKLVSDSIAYVVLTVNFKPQPPTPPAPVSVSSDTAYTFHFTNLRPGFGGNQLEWTLDSAFATSWYMTCYDTTIAGKDTSDCTITLTVPADSSALLWIRCIDTLSGCISDSRSSIAIVADVYQRQPINVDTIINVCKGYNTYVAIPNSIDTLRYDLLADTGRVAYAYGNDTTLFINTGNIYTPTFFTVFSTNTLTGDTATLGGSILVNPIEAVDTNIYFYGDTQVYVGDTICYEASANNGMTVIYSIPDSNATVNPATGCVCNIIDSIFTLRATIYGPSGCGSVSKDLLVHVTDIAPPVAPAPKTLILDTDIVVTITFDSIQMGAGGDRIQWATHEDFSDVHTILPYGSITIDLEAGMDTVIWLRSINRGTGGTSKKVSSKAKVLYPMISSGLLDKSKWDLTFNDEFNYQTYNEAFVDPVTRGWAPYVCWEAASNNICADNCGRHGFGKPNFTNFGNNGNGDGSSNELSFPGGGILRITASPLVPDYTAPACDGIVNTFTYKTGDITSRKLFIDPSKEGLLEIRCKLPSIENGSHPALWVFNGNRFEYDIMENSEGTKKTVANIHDWVGGDHVCGRTLTKASACDLSNDFHTYGMIFSTNELIMFVDGKETWSVARTGSTPFPTDAAIVSQQAIVMLGLGIDHNPAEPLHNATGDTYVMDVDYIRFYQSSDGTNNLPPSLQNLTSSGIAKTLESPNRNGQVENNTILPIANHNFNNGKTHDIAFAKMAYTNELGLQKIYYRGKDDYKCYNVYLDGANWVEYPLSNAGIEVTDVQGGITVDGNRVYYYSKAFELRYFQWTNSGWINRGTGVQTKGSLNVDALGRVFYLGLTDGNIWAWCPSDDLLSGQTVQITNNGLAKWGLAVHDCGCLIHYEDIHANLRQLSWWNNWRDNGVVVSDTLVQLTSAMLLEKENAITYFVGRDNDVHRYAWDYNGANPTGHLKLGTMCSDYNKASYITEPFENPQSFLCIGQNKDIVYYYGTDSKIWYYFKDHDHINPALPSSFDVRENWNKTCLRYDERSNGMFVTAPGDFGELFYTGRDNKLHTIRWLDADNPVDCSNLPSWGSPSNFFKTQTDTSEKSGHNANDILVQDLITVSVYPNPSTGAFTFNIQNLTSENMVEIIIEDILGRKVYGAKRQATERSITMVYNADNVNKDVYFYRVFVNGVVSTNGKLIKL